MGIFSSKKDKNTAAAQPTKKVVKATKTAKDKARNARLNNQDNF